MQYRYTVRGGYDRLIKKKIEKGTLFAVPLAILAIVGLAALTSNTTSGPGIGSGSSGKGGQATVTKTFQETANNQPAGSSASGAAQTNSGSSSGSTSSATTAQGSSGGTLGSASSRVTSIQPSSTGSGTTGGTTGGSGGGGGSSTTIVPPAPIPQPPVTICTKALDPLTGQEICIN